MLEFLSVLLSLASYPDSYSIYYANTYAYVSQAYSCRNRCFPLLQRKGGLFPFMPTCLVPIQTHLHHLSLHPGSPPLIPRSGLLPSQGLRDRNIRQSLDWPIL